MTEIMIVVYSSGCKEEINREGRDDETWDKIIAKYRNDPAVTHVEFLIGG